MGTQCCGDVRTEISAWASSLREGFLEEVASRGRQR